MPLRKLLHYRQTKACRRLMASGYRSRRTTITPEIPTPIPTRIGTRYTLLPKLYCDEIT